MIGRMQITADKPRPHLAALIEDMESHRAAHPAVHPDASAIRRTPVPEERDPRIEPSATPLVITIMAFVIVLGGALYWVF